MKKENDKKVNILWKIHLQQKYDLKQKNYVLTRNIDELEKRLASQDIEISIAQNILKISSEKKSKLKGDSCEFEAKSPKGLNTHEGHKHKDQVKPDIYYEPPAPENPPIEIYMCAFCEKNYDNLEELSKHAYCHNSENLNPLI